jgi:predicted dehydrogenase
MSKVRVGVIGAGWWAVENHIPALKSFPDVELAAVSRLGGEELKRVQGAFDVPFGTDNYLELLDTQELDGVVISSPHHLHYEHSAAALERGIHVVCEKPMALSSAEARWLCHLAEANKLHFVIPYGWNYSDLATAAREAIQGGQIGEIHYVHCHMASALRDLFSGEGAWFATTAFFKPELPTWSDPALGGGFAHGQLTHALGLLFWVTELVPVEVFAMMTNSKTGADLSNAICCRFRNGATGMLGGAATMPPGSTYQLDLRVFGSEGMLLLDIERPRVEIRRHGGRNSALSTTFEPGSYSCIEPLRVFVDLIQGKAAANPSSASVGARAVEVLDAAFRSARTGRIESI